jgi:hypothetical protein
MNKTGYAGIAQVTIFIFLITIFSDGCKKTDNPIKYAKGTFPDSVINLTDINSVYDDYNIALYQLSNDLPIIFSSNRESLGGQFDPEQANITYTFDQTTGEFALESAVTTDLFLAKLINKAKTSRNDFGPYRLFSTSDGFEYFILASENEAGNLDFYYLKNEPVYGTTLPEISGPYPIPLMNTSSDDAYICFNTDQDSAYYSSNKEGNFNIYLLTKPDNKDLSTWFNLSYEVPVKVDSINSAYDDKCPFISKKVMVFTSNRPGGFGGYDLYYSVFKNGKWSSPVNLGARINTSYDEYRPVIGYDAGFTNNYLMFSSNRSGGKGGFDLYFTGISFSSKK